MKERFPAKVSPGLLLFILIVFFGPMAYGVMVSGWSTAILVPIVILVVTFAFIMQLFYSTYYEIEDGELLVKCSFLINKKIAIDQISEVNKTNSLLASPAPSFDRIAIKFNSDYIIISPRDKHAFVERLKSVNPKIISKL